MKEDLIFDDLVRLSISENFPETIETDLPWIRTILQNLVHNAKKHGPKGKMINFIIPCCISQYTYFT